ncbi:hypothetical protein D3C86_2114530 [compost metagenome]
MGNQYFIYMVQQFAFVENADAGDIGIARYFVLNNFVCFDLQEDSIGLLQF